MHQILVNLEPIISPVPVGKSGLEPLGGPTVKVSSSRREYPKVESVQKDFETEIIQSQNGFISPECIHCQKFIVNEGVENSQFEPAESIHDGEVKFKWTITPVFDRAEGIKLSGGVDGYCNLCQRPNQSSGWTRWMGVESTIFPIPTEYSFATAQAHSYPLKKTRDCIHQAENFTTFFKK